MKTSIFYDRNIDNHRTLNFVRNTTKVVIDIDSFNEVDIWRRMPLLYSYDGTPKQLFSGLVSLDTNLWRTTIIHFEANEITGKKIREDGKAGAINWIHYYLCESYQQFVSIVVAAIKGEPLPVEQEEKPFVLQEGYNNNSPVVNKYEKQGVAVRQARKKTKKDNRIFSVRDIEQDTRTIVVPKDTETPAQKRTKKPKSLFDRKSKKTYIFETRLKTRKYKKI